MTTVDRIQPRVLTPNRTLVIATLASALLCMDCPAVGGGVARAGVLPAAAAADKPAGKTRAGRPQISISARPASVHVGDALVVSGRVLGSLPRSRRSLTLVLEERVGRRKWRGRATVRLGSGSRFEVLWRVPSAVRRHRVWLRLHRGRRVLAVSPHWFVAVRKRPVQPGPTPPAPGGATGSPPSGGGPPAGPAGPGTTSGASAVVGPGGGAVSLDGVGTLSFPAGSFDDPTTVAVGITRDADLAQRFEEDTMVFRADGRLEYEVRVDVPSQPLRDAQFTFEVPASFLAGLPANAEIRAFYLNAWSDAEEHLETFEMLPERFTGAPGTVTVTLPPYAFSSALGTDGAFHAVVLLAATPTARGSAGPASSALATRADPCQGTTIGPPLNGALEVTSPYGPRTHPVTGVPQSFHRGTDLRAASGTPVIAAAAGTVANVINSTTGGVIVVLRHDDGSASQYMHLETGSPVAVNTHVDAGAQIARADTTGQVTGPHLHFEYAPNGQIFQNDQKVDPMACIGATVSGSITVGDNGNLADDAFSVAIDGIIVCTTTIGASNTCAVGNLRPGTVTLTITAVVAPDDVGTYGISLGNGLTFAGGGTSVSGTLREGGSTSFEVIIPAPPPP